MASTQEFPVIRELRSKLLALSERLPFFALLDSNTDQAKYTYPTPTVYDLICGWSSGTSITPENSDYNSLKGLHKGWWFGHLSYELRTHFEKVSNNNPPLIPFPEYQFFEAEVVVRLIGERLSITAQNPSAEYDQLCQHTLKPEQDHEPIVLSPHRSKAAYSADIKAIKHHIQQGDIYEANYCQFFSGAANGVSPQHLWLKLNSMSPTPFAGFYKLNTKYLLCASPERYLQKQGSELVSQPIKGTARRGSTPIKDRKLSNELSSNPKEQAENIMIVDLVRNDFSRVAVANSVSVPELCGCYAFPKVFQLISTVKANLKPDKSIWDAISASFPMGSMTGAPKIMAMNLIDNYESHRRDLYSGSIGYIDPEDNADFNVVIRSLLLDQNTQDLAFAVGGAITSGSSVEAEYDECMAKAQSIFELVNQSAKPSEGHIENV